ncbi:unnamed protein product [Heligmosomoides polygyrus]|uniref:DUF5641 domain-containing protein n=1 Tax=Heligmosomoides polygyrus TaxID=6339 RepID=A0A183G9Y2_HELPZ|nr:unnamed protein product [Heligmosomoides polygyrus]
MLRTIAACSNPPNGQDTTLRLATQKQVETALTSSVKLTEDFWNIWSAQYLTSLREHHKRARPKKDTIVILVDPDQSRNTWNIGRISDIRYERQSPIREVTIELPSKRKIRRPINKVIPLEIDADNTISGQQTSHEETPKVQLSKFEVALQKSRVASVSDH